MRPGAAVCGQALQYAARRRVLRAGFGQGQRSCSDAGHDAESQRLSVSLP